MSWTFEESPKPELPTGPHLTAEKGAVSNAIDAFPQDESLGMENSAIPSPWYARIEKPPGFCVNPRPLFTMVSGGSSFGGDYQIWQIQIVGFVDKKSGRKTLQMMRIGATRIFGFLPFETWRCPQQFDRLSMAFKKTRSNSRDKFAEGSAWVHPT